MIKEVFTDHTTFNELPLNLKQEPRMWKVFMACVLRSFTSRIWDWIIPELRTEAPEICTEKLTAMGDIRIIGEAKEKTSLISFLSVRYIPTMQE